MATPAKKGLSAGTLNLKFMTRAAANDGTAAPALEKKKIVDEGEWDIGPDVRRALGIQGSSSSRGPGESSSVSYESSYMPFITGNTVKGRFSFKDGTRQESLSLDTTLEEITAGDDANDASGATGASSSRPKAISRQPPPKKVKRVSPPPSSARNAPPALPHTAPKPPETFMRPAGVDAPPLAVTNPKKRSAVDDSSKNQKTGKNASSSRRSTALPVPEKKKKKKAHAEMDVDSE